MAKTIKSKRISITTFDKAMKAMSVPVKTVEWNGIEIEIKHTLPLKDVLTFVENVASSCFATDNSYLPEIKVFAIKCSVLEMYANFTLPANVEHKYDLIYNTDAFDVVAEHINAKQFNEIVEAINEKVYNSADANVAMANQKINEIYTAFDGLLTQVGDVFSGLSSDEIISFMSAVTNSRLDESKIVEAYKATSKAKDGE